MPTIQFTYDTEDNHYCFGIWLNGVFIVRCKSKDREYLWERFIKELKQMEGERA